MWNEGEITLTKIVLVTGNSLIDYNIMLNVVGFKANEI